MKSTIPDIDTDGKVTRISSSYARFIAYLSGSSCRRATDNVLINYHDVAKILDINVNSDIDEIRTKLEEALKNEYELHTLGGKIGGVYSEVLLGLSNLRNEKMLLKITRQFLQDTLDKVTQDAKSQTAMSKQGCQTGESKQSRFSRIVNAIPNFIAEMAVRKYLTGSYRKPKDE